MKKYFAKQLLFLFILISFILRCSGGSESSENNNVPVSGLNIAQTAITIHIGYTSQLTAVINPSNATNQNVTWSSSDETKATVSPEGLVTAIAPATDTIITATAEDGHYSDTCTVTTDIVNVNGITLDKSAVTINVGFSDQLIATITPTDSTDKNVIWTSSDETKAEVSDAGLVTAYARGSATITATTDDGGYQATCDVTISEWSTHVTIGGGTSDSASIAGDYAIVGVTASDGFKGAAFIYHRTGPNSWDAGAKISAPDISDSNWFGISVSISGDYAIVGSYRNNNGGTARGAAYIFHRTDTNTWDSGIKITAFDIADYDYYGYSVAISGDYAVVGCGDKDSDQGAAYIYHRTGTNTWDTGQKIVASDRAIDDYFGSSVSISGDYAIVGAVQGTTKPGAAYIYRRTGTNSWDSGTKISASDATDLDRFGNSVSISGDYVIIGADEKDESGTNRGAAYIYNRTGSNSWTADTKLTSPSPVNNGYFGMSVSISEGYVIIGSLNETNRAYIYK